MENSIVTLGLFFEIKDSEMYGGEGTVGYVSIMFELPISSLTSTGVCNYAEQQRKGMANMCRVDIEKVKVIPRTEYEEATEEEEEVYTDYDDLW